MALVKLDFDPSRRKLQQFGGILVVVLVVLGCFALLRGTVLGIDLTVSGARNAGYALLGGAGVAGAASLLAPKGLRPLFVLLSLLTTPIGFVLSYMLLFVMYFFVFTPIGLAMRATGWDPMRRRRDAAATTYWLQRGPSPDASRYFNQY